MKRSDATSTPCARPLTPLACLVTTSTRARASAHWRSVSKGPALMAA
jgi:hypothetical protein